MILKKETRKNLDNLLKNMLSIFSEAIFKMTDDPDGYEIIPYDAGLDLDRTGFSVVEKGVRDLVKVLWKLGYKTVCCCAGHERALEPYPWITISLAFSGAEERLEKLFKAVARFNISLGTDGNLPEALKAWVLLPMITPSGLAAYLQPYDSNLESSSGKISQLRKASSELALFIEQECKDVFSGAEPKN